MSGESDFPAALDTFPVIGPSTQEDAVGFEHDVMHNKAFAAIAAVQAKVGADTSPAPSSLEARVAALETGGASGLAITGVCQDIEVGDSFAFSPTLVGGNPPVRWDVLIGALPSGVSLHAATGEHTGVAGVVGDYAWLLAATEANGSSAVSYQKTRVSPASKPVHLRSRASYPGQYSGRIAYLPDDYAVGDMVVIFSPVGITIPSGWTRIGGAPSAYPYPTCFYRVMDGTEGVSVPLSGSTAAAPISHLIQAGTFDPATPPQISWVYGSSIKERPLPAIANPWMAKTLFIAAVGHVALNGPVSVEQWPLPDIRLHASLYGGGSAWSSASCSTASSSPHITLPSFIVSGTQTEYYDGPYCTCLIAIKPIV